MTPVPPRIAAAPKRTAPLKALALAALLALPLAAPAADALPRIADPAAEVNIFLGTDWYGRVFVGATEPFGTVKLGPDMVGFDGVPSKSGYLSAGRILGFSHLHVSGTAGKYGNVQVMASTGERFDPDDLASARDRETASPGYYAAHLTRPGVTAELTATRRVGLHRYRFDRSGPAHLSVKLDHILVRGTGAESQRFLGGTLERLSPTEIAGVGRYIGGWNQGGEYRVYFHLVSDTPAQAQTLWRGDERLADAAATLDGDRPFGAALHYDAQAGQAVQLKIGISFVSAEQARRNVEEEAPGWDFDAVHAATRAAWNDQLARVQVSPGDTPRRRQLYTGIYHSMLMPSDRTGENPKWTSAEPDYDDYYAIWDTFRTVGPLLTLIAPERQRAMLRSLVDIYRHTGWMPDARSGNDNGRTQGGSNSDVMVADAFAKGLDGIDYATALQAMRKNAEVQPDNPRQHGRDGVDAWHRLGYLPADIERAGSRTVEYAYNDFAIAQLACGLGQREVAREALARAGNWRNLWDPDLDVEGVRGFIRPRNADGSWGAPDLTKRGSWTSFFYEGDLRTYSLYAPHDVAGLMALSGGPEAFVRRLDWMFDRFHFDMTNEPGFLIPVLYHWAGRPERSIDRVFEYLDKWFQDARGGLPANDDSGAMSSWLVFHQLGLYPVAGKDVYLIGRPSYARSELDLGGGRTLRIVAHNHDSEGLNRYVQSATLDGAPLDTAWFRHRDIADGATLELVMGPEPSDWGRATPPPSLSDPGFALCGGQ
ncbi:GH92 family glycosyl hydrolase [Luteimonas huabeiensis]|uniref:GH92 family glycosyl hydrolase n=1 Tax=Luteimonas huabeiensis TaxID=1244513 RepID=UPI00046728F5|nr:GH92 family glycosyl hydrolase [Luteimonas huabeiensis]